MSRTFLYFPSEVFLSKVLITSFCCVYLARAGHLSLLRAPPSSCHPYPSPSPAGSCWCFLRWGLRWSWSWCPCTCRSGWSCRCDLSWRSQRPPAHSLIWAAHSSHWCIAWWWPMTEICEKSEKWNWVRKNNTWYTHDSIIYVCCIWISIPFYCTTLKVG